MKKTLIQEYLLYLSKNRVCGIPSQLGRTDTPFQIGAAINTGLSPRKLLVKVFLQEEKAASLLHYPQVWVAEDLLLQARAAERSGVSFSSIQALTTEQKLDPSSVGKNNAVLMTFVLSPS